jgi:hypothetical protein
LALAITLTACGGGSDDDDAARSGVDLRSFSLGSSSVAAPQTGSVGFDATWSATASGLAATAYHVSAHAIPAGAATSTAGDNNKFLGRNCSAAFPCANPETLACTYGSNRVLSCSMGVGVNLQPGSYTIVAKACWYDTALNSVCATRQTALTVG